MSFEEGVVRGIVREEVEAGLSKRKARKPKIINKTMTTANKEYEIPLPAKTKKFTAHLRETDTAFKIAFERGSVDGATPAREYFTVHAGTPYWEDDLDLDAIFILCVACASAGKIVEVIAWR